MVCVCYAIGIGQRVKHMFDKDQEEARDKILQLVRGYAEKYHNSSQIFKPGDDIRYASFVALSAPVLRK